MKTISKNKLWLASVIAGALFSGSAMALPTVTINDTYQGSDSHGYGDRIGGSTFEIHDMDVTLIGTVLNVQINTNYAGHTGLFGTGYGDLFLSSEWIPFGNGPEYLLDDNVTGTKWTYGLSIDNDVFNQDGSLDTINSTRYTNDVGGTASLYQLTGATNDDNAILSEDVINPAYTFRNGQEVIVDTGERSPAVDTNIDGNWLIDANDFISFTIDLAGTNLLLGDEIALHWGMTCGNDTIEGAYDISVPAPGILLLLSTGLIGMFAVGRRKA